jgi:hypothetical protein
MKDLSEIPCNPDLRIASLDISNMYTNIPRKDLLNIIENTCKNNGLESAVKQEILGLTRMIITQNYFRFQNTTYTQKSGLAMGGGGPFIFHPIRDLSTVDGKHKDFRDPKELQNRRILQICRRYTHNIKQEPHKHRRSLHTVQQHET